MTCSVCYCGQGRHSGARSQRLICFSQVCCHCTPEQWPHNFPHWGWVVASTCVASYCWRWAGCSCTLGWQSPHSTGDAPQGGLQTLVTTGWALASEVHLAPQASSAARGQARPVQRGATLWCQVASGRQPSFMLVMQCPWAKITAVILRLLPNFQLSWILLIWGTVTSTLHSLKWL